jgi:hypothetical protein
MSSDIITVAPSPPETFAFIITAKTCNAFQQHLLKECIRHIRVCYPTHTIYILDDNSLVSVRENTFAGHQDPNLHIYPALASCAGELNAYLFCVDERCGHTRVVFIHDSVFLKALLPFCYDNNVVSLDVHPIFQPFWKATQHVWRDIFIPPNNVILNNMVFFFDSPSCPTKRLFRVLKEFQQGHKGFAVTFGAMGMFNTSFVRFIQARTNLFAIAHLFTLRSHRCLFERIISCLMYMQQQQIRNDNFLCGDIFDHPAAFSNTNINPPHSPPRPIFIKVWQGR